MRVLQTGNSNSPKKPYHSLYGFFMGLNVGMVLPDGI